MSYQFEKGVAQGRFHIIHHGHMEYLLEAKKLCRHLYIGISDPDPQRSYFDYEALRELDEKSFEPLRFEDSQKIYPFTYFERHEMIRVSLLEAGVPRGEFDIVPFPMHTPQLLKYYIPTDVMILLTIYDEWGRHKVAALKKLGFETYVMWERGMESRFTTGSEVRRRIKAGEEWESLVPKAVFRYLSEKLLTN